MKTSIRLAAFAAALVIIFSIASAAADTTPPPAAETPAIPPPTVLISRDAAGTVLGAGEETTVNITVQNLAGAPMTMVTVQLTPSDGLTLQNAVTSYTLPDILPGMTQTIPLRVKASDSLSAAAQTIAVDLRYVYFNGTSPTVATSSDKVSVPCKPKDKVSHTAPVISLERTGSGETLAAGQSGLLEFLVRNLGDTAIRRAVATVTASDGLTLTGSASAFLIGDIEPGADKPVGVAVKVPDGAASENQTVSLELRFTYDNGESVTAGTAEAKAYVPIIPKPKDASAPVPALMRSPIEAAIKSGQEFSVTLWIKNLGGTAMIKPLASLTASDGLTIIDADTTLRVPDIEPNGDAKLVVKLRAAKDITSANQSIGVDLRYSYASGSSEQTASSSDKVTIPCEVRDKKSLPVPTLILTRSPITSAISANQSFSMKLTYKNAGKTAVYDAAAVLSASDGLMLTDDVTTFLLPAIAPGKSADITIHLKAAKEIGTAVQSVQSELKFTYNNGETETSGSASDRVTIPANVTKPDDTKTDASVPNIIVESFDYGGQPAAAGKDFPLKLTFRNTSPSLGLQNIVATVETGESFALNGSSNTVYYESIEASGSRELTLPMKALPSAKTGAQPVELSFKYEYVDGKKRASSTGSVKLSIPIYQPDRFTIDAPVLPGTATAGEELTLALAYVNKGKSEVSNVAAEIVGDGIDTPARTQNLGNFEPGKSGSIGFALTPQSEGDVSFTLKVTYEDSNQTVRTKEFPVTLQVTDPVPVDDAFMPDVTEEEAQPGFPWLWVGIGAGAAVLITVIALLRVRKKKKKSAAAYSWDDGDAETPAETASGEAQETASGDKK